MKTMERQQRRSRPLIRQRKVPHHAAGWRTRWHTPQVARAGGRQQQRQISRSSTGPLHSERSCSGSGSRSSSSSGSGSQQRQSAAAAPAPAPAPASTSTVSSTTISSTASTCTREPAGSNEPAARLLQPPPAAALVASRDAWRGSDSPWPDCHSATPPSCTFIGCFNGGEQEMPSI